MDIDVRTQHEVITIAPREGKVTVRAVQQGTEESSALHVMLFFENLIPDFDTNRYIFPDG
jgi:hypothetical protein